MQFTVCGIKPAQDPISHVSQPVDTVPLIRSRSALRESGSSLTEVSESDELKAQLEELQESLVEVERAMVKGKEEERQRDNEISHLQQALAVESRR